MVKYLPFADLQIPVPGFGAMGFSQSYGPAKDEESLKTLAKAVELGCTFWDSAVVYGGGHNESLIGQFLAQSPGVRGKLFIASKCGQEVNFETKQRKGIVNNSAEHINEYIEGTIERLGTTPDLYYLHRIEPGRDLNESIGALAALKSSGKTKYIGLSECGAKTLRAACATAHIDALQIEYSPWFTDHETNDLIATAQELGVAIIAYSPLGRGLLTGAYSTPSDFVEGDSRLTQPQLQGDLFKANMRLVDEFKKLAEKKGCTPAQLSLAWVAAMGAIAIPGTKTAGRLEENFGAREINLTEEEMKELRVLIEDAKPRGERYAPAVMAQIGY